MITNKFFCSVINLRWGNTTFLSLKGTKIKKILNGKLFIQNKKKKY